jgi:hypothetical protein
MIKTPSAGCRKLEDEHGCRRDTSVMVGPSRYISPGGQGHMVKSEGATEAIVRLQPMVGER